MRRIKFTAQGANSVLGGFQSGDIARVSASFAAHLVNEARVAVYLDAANVSVDQEKPPKIHTARRRKRSNHEINP